MPKQNPEGVRKTFEEKIANRPFYPHATRKTLAEKEVEKQKAILEEGYFPPRSDSTLELPYDDLIIPRRIRTHFGPKEPPKLE